MGQPLTYPLIPPHPPASAASCVSKGERVVGGHLHLPSFQEETIVIAVVLRAAALGSQEAIELSLDVLSDFSDQR